MSSFETRGFSSISFTCVDDNREVPPDMEQEKGDRRKAQYCKVAVFTFSVLLVVSEELGINWE